MSKDRQRKGVVTGSEHHIRAAESKIELSYTKRTHKYAVKLSIILT